jgi:hypothetical protein
LICKAADAGIFWGSRWQQFRVTRNQLQSPGRNLGDSDDPQNAFGILNSAKAGERLVHTRRSFLLCAFAGPLHRLYSNDNFIRIRLPLAQQKILFSRL